jgi:hypothetical protein
MHQTEFEQLLAVFVRPRMEHRLVGGVLRLLKLGKSTSAHKL